MNRGKQVFAYASLIRNFLVNFVFESKLSQHSIRNQCKHSQSQKLEKQRLREKDYKEKVSSSKIQIKSK